MGRRRTRILVLCSAVLLEKKLMRGGLNLREEASDNKLKKGGVCKYIKKKKGDGIRESGREGNGRKLRCRFGRLQSEHAD